MELLKCEVKRRIDGMEKMLAKAEKTE